MAVNGVQQAEVAVSSSSVTRLDPSPIASRLYVEVVNNGNYTIWLVPTTGSEPTITVRKATPVAPGQVYLMALGTAVHLYALAEAMTQVTGEATIVTEYAGT